MTPEKASNLEILRKNPGIGIQPCPTPGPSPGRNRGPSQFYPGERSLPFGVLTSAQPSPARIYPSATFIPGLQNNPGIGVDPREKGIFPGVFCTIWNGNIPGAKQIPRDEEKWDQPSRVCGNAQGEENPGMGDGGWEIIPGNGDSWELLGKKNGKQESMEINWDRKKGKQENPRTWGWENILGNVDSQELLGIHGNKLGDKEWEAGEENWESELHGNKVGQEKGDSGFSRDAGMGIIPWNGHSQGGPGSDSSQREREQPDPEPSLASPNPSLFLSWDIFIPGTGAAAGGSCSWIYPGIIPQIWIHPRIIPQIQIHLRIIPSPSRGSGSIPESFHGSGYIPGPFNESRSMPGSSHGSRSAPGSSQALPVDPDPSQPAGIGSGIRNSRGKSGIHPSGESGIHPSGESRIHPGGIGQESALPRC